MDTSKSLLERAKDDPKSDAWFKLISIYEPLITGWIVRAGVEQSEVDDISQEVFQTLSRELEAFEHNGRTGAFRNWLKITTVNRCRRYWDSKKRRSELSGTIDGPDVLNQLADPNSELSKTWDNEHDHYVIDRILKMVEREFDRMSFEVFVRNVLKAESPELLAREYEIPVGQVYKIKFRVMKRLRQEADELVNISSFFEKKKK